MLRELVQSNVDNKMNVIDPNAESSFVVYKKYRNSALHNSEEEELIMPATFAHCFMVQEAIDKRPKLISQDDPLRERCREDRRAA